MSKKNEDQYTNPYDALPREERSLVYYSKEHSSRKEERDFLDSMSRLLPVAKGSTPITQETMRKLFRGKSGKQKQEERAAKREANEAAKRAETQPSKT